MEHVMHNDNVHRRANGTIDIDFYRREAFFLRREATTKFFRRVGQIGRPLIKAVTIIITYTLLSPRGPLPPSTESIFVSASVPLLPIQPNT
jgi:hypothetical protein